MCEVEFQFENETEKKCKTCAFLRTREEDKKTTYFCNEQGMVTTMESLLPEECDRYRKKKEVEDVLQNE